MKKLKLPKIIEYTALSLIFTLPAAWLVLYAVCRSSWWRQVCNQDGFMSVTILVIVLTLAPIGYIYRERALRRARRGMWAGGGLAWGQRAGRLYDNVTRLAFEPPEPEGEIVGQDRFERRGWWVWVPVGGGRQVWVDRRDFWQWLVEIEQAAQGMQFGASVIGQRRWEPELGRERWMAYCDILLAVGAIEYSTADPRSRRYIPGAPWGRVEAYEQLRPSEAR